MYNGSTYCIFFFLSNWLVMKHVGRSTCRVLQNDIGINLELKKNCGGELAVPLNYLSL